MNKKKRITDTDKIFSINHAIFHDYFFLFLIHWDFKLYILGDLLCFQWDRTESKQERVV